MASNLYIQHTVIGSRLARRSVKQGRKPLARFPLLKGVEMSALMKIIDSFRGQRMLEEYWPLGDKALEEYNQLLLTRDEQYKELEFLRGKLNAVVGAVQTLSGLTTGAADKG